METRNTKHKHPISTLSFSLSLSLILQLLNVKSNSWNYCILCCYYRCLRQVARYSRDNWPQVWQDLPRSIAVAAGHKLCDTVGGVGHFIVTRVFRLLNPRWVSGWVDAQQVQSVQRWTASGALGIRWLVTACGSNRQQATGSNSNSNNYTASCQVRPGGGIVHTDYTDNNVGLLAMTAKDALWLWPLGTEESRCYLSTRQVARVSNLLWFALLTSLGFVLYFKQIRLSGSRESALNRANHCDLHE